VTDFDNRPAIIEFVEKANRTMGKPMAPGMADPSGTPRRPSSTTYGLLSMPNPPPAKA
jgi:hypothetical protein